MKINGKQLYIVLMDDSYVRDTEFMDTEDLSEEEFQELWDSDDPYLTGNWVTLEGVIPYIGMCLADSPEEAVRLCAGENCYDPRSLYAKTPAECLYYATKTYVPDGSQWYVLVERWSNKRLTNPYGKLMTFATPEEAMAFAETLA